MSSDLGRGVRLVKRQARNSISELVRGPDLGETVLRATN